MVDDKLKILISLGVFANKSPSKQPPKKELASYNYEKESLSTMLGLLETSSADLKGEIDKQMLLVALNN